MIFRIKNIYVSISNYFFVMLAWVVLIGGVRTFILCFSSLIIHEMGHIIMIYLVKERINIFYILPLGFCCRLKNQNKISDNRMIKILIAGPATSLCVAGILFFWTKELALVNLLIGLFNLLPIGSLDGGRLIKIIN